MCLPAAAPDVDDWEYFKFSTNLKIELLPQEESEDIFEVVVVVRIWVDRLFLLAPKLVLKETPYFKPNVINGTMNGNNVYRTSDLLQRHPRDPNLWRIVGRADDQLMLSTGEKVI